MRTWARAQAGAGCRYSFLTQKERDNETGLDYFLARYYSSTQGRFTSPDEFSGGPDELYDFADDASENPTFYAELDNPQSLNKYQYTYNNPVNLTDDDGHCIPCVVVVVVVTIEILSAPDTVNAPGPGDRTYPSGDGVKSLMANATFGVIGGPIISKAGRGVLKAAFGREATEVVGEAAAKGGRTEAKIPSGQRVKPPTKNQRQAVYAANRAKNSGELKCEMCGNKMTPAKKSAKGVSPKPNEATVDHIKPRSRGGTNEPKNLRPACRKCNRDKSDND